MYYEGSNSRDIKSGLLTYKIGRCLSWRNSSGLTNQMNLWRLRFATLLVRSSIESIGSSTSKEGCSRIASTLCCCLVYSTYSCDNTFHNESWGNMQFWHFFSQSTRVSNSFFFGTMHTGGTRLPVEKTENNAKHVSPNDDDVGVCIASLLSKLIEKRSGKARFWTWEAWNMYSYFEASRGDKKWTDFFSPSHCFLDKQRTMDGRGVRTLSRDAARIKAQSAQHSRQDCHRHFVLPSVLRAPLAWFRSPSFKHIISSIATLRRR